MDPSMHSYAIWKDSKSLDGRAQVKGYVESPQVDN
jgi:hypothetical protein